MPNEAICSRPNHSYQILNLNVRMCPKFTKTLPGFFSKWNVKINMQKNFKAATSSQAVEGLIRQSEREKKKNSKRKGGNRCIRQKTFKINFFKSVAEFKLKMQLLKSCSDGKANLRILEWAKNFVPSKLLSWKETLLFNPQIPGFLNWVLMYTVKQIAMDEGAWSHSINCRDLAGVST